MKIEPEQLIEGYFNLIKDEYPDLTLKELTLICKSPFKHIKMLVRQVNLPKVRWRFFGSFFVYQKRIENAQPVRALLKGVINERKFAQITEVLNYYDENKKPKEV